MGPKCCLMEISIASGFRTLLQEQDSLKIVTEIGGGDLELFCLRRIVKLNACAFASGRNPRQRQSASDTKRGYLMKLDEWFTRLVTVPPGQSRLAYGLAIGMRIALFVLVLWALLPPSRSFFCTDDEQLAPGRRFTDCRENL